MDVATLVTLLDQNAKNEIEHRLYFTQREGTMAETTRTVVYATDPLKDISNPFECIMTVPTDPPSNKVQLIGGHFFANGKLYPFPGMETEEIDIDGNQDTYVLTGIRIDPDTDRTDLYTQVTHGEWPFMDRAVVPSALIKIPRGYTTITSAFIIDIRPFIHYNVSTPEDRAVIDISCINPNESVSFELMRNKRLPPIINFYKKLPPEGVHTFTQAFNSLDDITVLGDDKPDWQSGVGITLKKKITEDPISLADSQEVVFVSAQYGNDANDGSLSRPLSTLTAAINRFNGMSQYTTIFLAEGIYSMATTAKQVITRNCTIIGAAATLVSVRFPLPITALEAQGGILTFRTVQFSCSNVKSTSSPNALMEVTSGGTLALKNCIIKQLVNSETVPLISVEANLFCQNCVFHNPYYTNTGSKSYFYVIPAGASSTSISIRSSYIIGTWKTVFPSNAVTDRNFFDTGDGSSLNLDDMIEYHSGATSPGEHAGLSMDGIAVDKDNSPISVGLYGGPYAAKFRISEYPINEIPVFKYAYHSLYSPVIARFVSVTPIIGFTPAQANCHVYGAVSFNGGHDWLVWDEMLGAFKRIANLETLDVNGNDATYLAQRVVDMGPIQTKGEICFAWALKTGSPDHTPNIMGVNMTVKANADTITPISPEDFDVWIAEDTVMVRNKTSEKINDVVMVAY